MLAKLNSKTITFTVAILYAIELLDEVIYGLHGAAAPLMKSDLALSYTEIGLLTTIPGFVGIVLEPLFGVLGDTRWRRALVRGGIIATTGALALVAFGQTFAILLTAFVILYVASGVYVNLAQATLMDRDPARTDQSMARWTLIGSVGVTIAPVAATIAFGLGYGWRGLYLALAGAAGVYVALIWQLKFDMHTGAEEESVGIGQMLRDLWKALGKWDLIRWVLLAELGDLMVDKLYDVTGLYFHDVAGVSFEQAAAAGALFTAAGLLGNFLLVPLLERVNGLKVLRWSSAAVLGLYVAFLLVPNVGMKYVLIALVSFGTAGWYAVLRGRTYAALPGQSGMVVAVSAVGNFSIILTPTILGLLADAFGLQAAMWILVVGPLALILGLPRGEEG